MKAHRLLRGWAVSLSGADRRPVGLRFVLSRRRFYARRVRWVQ